MKSITALLAASLLTAAAASPLHLPSLTLEKRAIPSDLSNLTIAAVRAAPVNWKMPILDDDWTGITYDLNGTVDYGVELIAQAASAGASVVAFPECWFPGYPKGSDDEWRATHLADYIENSLVVDSPQWNKLLQAASDNAVYVGLGYTEREGDKIYMAQALVDPQGQVLIHRHKLRPSGGERTLFSDGTIDQLEVVSTPIGRISMLECWEHYHPSMTFPIQVQTPDLHIGPFPYQTYRNDTNGGFWEVAETNWGAVRTFGISAGAVTVTPAIGGAIIMSAVGETLAESDGATNIVSEPIIYASVNATAFRNVTYDVNSEQSWGILKQIEAAIPDYIPRENGTFVNQVNNSLTDLLASVNASTTLDLTDGNTTATAGSAAAAQQSSTSGAAFSTPFAAMGLIATGLGALALL
ncbi:hypothetical protein JCM6882_007846 [Rhodosporidiobolus microsporus]